MSPVWIIEGRREPTESVAQQSAAERKLTALSEAVREHEQRLNAEAPAARPPDRYLYDRRREICGDG